MGIVALGRENSLGLNEACFEDGNRCGLVCSGRQRGH